MNRILTVEGYRAPPGDFVKKLEAFDPNLRVVWGLGQMVPFPGWVIERRIPDTMKAKVYGGNKPGNRERYADQGIVDKNGDVIGRRRFDMQPDWHPIMAIHDGQGNPVMELGDWVIANIAKDYERTLLGFPELSRRHLIEDRAEKALRDAANKELAVEDGARLVMDAKTQVFPESFAFGGQPEKVKKGTQI